MSSETESDLALAGEVEPRAAAVPGRGRKIAAWVLLAVATLLTIVACLSVWVKRQVMDTGNWTHTSSQLIRDPAIQAATAQYLSEQVSENPAVQPLVQEVLPPRLDPLGPAIAGGLGELTDRAAKRALTSDRFQQLWIGANRRAQSRLIEIIEQEGDQRAIVLDLRPMLGRLSTRVGLGDTAAAALQGQRGLVTIVEADEVASLRKGAKLLSVLPVISVILALLAFTASVYLSRGRRARKLVATGAAILGAGLAVLFIRRLLGNHVVEVAAADGAAVEAARATWAIGTSLLAQAATSLVIVGAVVIAAGWLGTGGSWATSVRRRIAPGVAHEPAIAYGVAILVVFALLAWGPIPALHTWLGALVLLLAVLGGVAALRGVIERDEAASGSERRAAAEPPAATA